MTEINWTTNSMWKRRRKKESGKEGEERRKDDEEGSPLSYQEEGNVLNGMEN